jgi:hypothetical protein
MKKKKEPEVKTFWGSVSSTAVGFLALLGALASSIDKLSDVQSGFAWYLSFGGSHFAIIITIVVVVVITPLIAFLVAHSLTKK